MARPVPALGRRKKPRRPVAPIFADALYPIAAFDAAAGISIQKRRWARRQGLPLPTIRVGQRVYVRGADGISWLVALAELASPRDEGVPAQ